MKRTIEVTHGKRGVYLAIFIVVVEAFLFSLALYQGWPELYRATIMVALFLVAVCSYTFWINSGKVSNLFLLLGCLFVLIGSGLLMIYGASSVWVLGMVGASGVTYCITMIIIAL